MEDRQYLDDETRTLIEEQEKLEGVFLSKLEPNTHLEVVTKNSVYQITTVEGILVNIKGGFRSDGTIRYETPRPAFIHGSTWGGSLLKLGWLGLGMNLEISENTFERIVTSTILSIRITAPDESWYYDLILDQT